MSGVIGAGSLTYALAWTSMNARLSTKAWFLGAVVVLAVALPGRGAQAGNPLLGRWLLERKGVAATMPYKLEWEFTKDQMVVRIVRASGEVKEASRNSYAIDTTKNPKWVTVTIGGQKPEIRNGIFRVVGAELHLKQAIGGGPRPLDFGAADYSVLKRVGQPDGAANRSQPAGSETNRTPSAAGSRR